MATGAATHDHSCRCLRQSLKVSDSATNSSLATRVRRQPSWRFTYRVRISTLDKHLDRQAARALLAAECTRGAPADRQPGGRPRFYAMFRGLVSARFAFLVALTCVVPAVAAGQQPQRPLAASISTARAAAPPPVSEIPEGSASMSPDERRTMEAVRMGADETIALDGMLDDAVWMRAIPATNFIQRDPDSGQRATESTEVRIVYNGDKLYIGVTCFDSEPDKLLANQMARDGNMGGDDEFQWVCDTLL